MSIIKILGVVLLMAAIEYFSVGVAYASGEIAVTKFNVVTKLEPDNSLLLKLDSDVLDSLNLYVVVYRTYKRLDEATKKTDEEYLAYQDTNLTAGELKAGKRYILDHAKWKQDFSKRQAENGPLRVRLLPKTISGSVTVSVGLAKNDTLGNGNTRLTGAAVAKEVWGDKTLKAQKNVVASLGGTPKHSPSLNPDNLEIGRSYITGRLNTPLMPDYNPANKMAAIAQAKQLPAGTPITILRRKTFDGEVWYEVKADFNSFNLSGWISGQALANPEAIAAQ